MDVSSIHEQEGKKTLSKLERQLIGLLQHGALTRDRMVELLGVPRTTIYDGLRRLIKLDIVTSSPVQTHERVKGRPRVLFSLFDAGGD